MARTRARRTVMKESGKWRSGREKDLSVSIVSSGRGGKRPSMLGREEGVGGEDHRDMVVPAGPPSALEVVEAELTLEVLVHALGPPPLLNQPHERLLADLAQRHQEELGGLLFAVGPLGDEPLDRPRRRVGAVVVRGDDASEDEPARENPDVPSRQVTRR